MGIVKPPTVCATYADAVAPVPDAGVSPTPRSQILALIEPSSYFKKHPPVQYTDEEARHMTEEFIAKYGWKGKNAPAKKTAKKPGKKVAKKKAAPKKAASKKTASKKAAPKKTARKAS